MSSEPVEWDEKIDLTWREYFKPPWMLPHIGIVQLARRIGTGSRTINKITLEVIADTEVDPFRVGVLYQVV